MSQPDPNYGYGQPGYGQPVGQPGYGAPQEHPQSQTIFILGIVGIFVGVVSFIAWYTGAQAKKEIASGAPYTWEGSKAKTGYTLGKVFSIIYIAVIVFYVIAMIVLLSTAASFS